MPSSTSNSRERAVEGPWLRTWVLVAAIAAGLLGVLEVRLRSLGHMPAVKQDPELWALHRHEIYSTSKTPVVIVGSSRVSAGFDPVVFNERYPNFNAIMLAKAGRAGAATLVDLAEDENFHGIVVFAAAPDQMLKRSRKEQRFLIRGYRNAIDNYGYLNRFANRRISAAVDDRLAFRAVRFDVVAWLWDVVRGKTPEAPAFMRGRADGYRALDFTKANVDRQRKGG